MLVELGVLMPEEGDCVLFVWRRASHNDFVTDRPIKEEMLLCGKSLTNPVKMSFSKVIYLLHEVN